MNISSVRDNTMCSRDRVHEREKERERERRGAPCRRLDDAPEGTVLHRLSTNIVTLSPAFPSLYRDFLAFWISPAPSVARAEYRRWRAISTMARVDREGFHFFEVSCDCVTERGTTRFRVSFGKGESEKNEMERLYVSARQVILISAKFCCNDLFFLFLPFSRYTIEYIFELFNFTIIRSELCFF